MAKKVPRTEIPFTGLHAVIDEYKETKKEGASLPSFLVRFFTLEYSELLLVLLILLR
ncbi:hypothetical protein J2Z34_000538 [Youngiibacter multivorans]|uniref:Uncharacterized protein n=1 Tax=Youngiibacter multivorans TaxID=937251 RepID=A0ABS4G0K5_9CLOT|nr:hypothetical protein [Youngiibacter multivorans]